MAQFFDRPVTVKINRVRQIDNLDGGLRGEADFFSQVTVGGKAFVTQVSKGQNNLSPTDWIFTNPVANTRLVPIKIELFESDNGGNSTNTTNTRVDVNPSSGRKELNLSYDLLTGQVTDANTGQVYATSRGQTISLQGAGDSSRGAIEFNITGVTSSDTTTQELFEGSPASGTNLGGFSDTMAVGDFNNGGNQDLAVGAPSKGSQLDGGVNVFVGANGLLQPSSFFNRGNVSSGNGQIGVAELGASTAVGDFDNDGFDDLLAGAPLESVSSQVNVTGSIYAIYGSSSGLNRNDSQRINQETPGILSGAAQFESFGASLATADFNKDGFADAAIGVTGNVEGAIEPGAVQIVYGSPTGLNETRHPDQLFGENLPGVVGTGEDAEAYGSALTTGDFDGDGNIDLAVGISNNKDGNVRAGAVEILYGSPTGLTTRSSLHSQKLGGFGEQNGNGFGAALAAGDFDDNGITDLAVGAPGAFGTGGVYIYSGRQGQNLSNAPQFFRQDPILGSPAETGDRFGTSLAAGDLNNNGVTDLAIGAPGEDNAQGAAHVLFGTRNVGITTASPDFLKQGFSGVVSGVAENGDKFGTSLAIGNFGKGTELAVSTPGEDFNSFTDAGVINVVPSAVF